MLREFGAAQYREVMTWPYRLIVRGIQIERQREAEAQLTRLRLQAIADGVELGKEYVPGQDDPKPTGKEGHWSRKPYLSTERALERAARPWEHTTEKLIARRIAEEAAEFEKFERDIAQVRAQA